MRKALAIILLLARSLCAQNCPSGYTLSGAICVANGSGGGGSSPVTCSAGTCSFPSADKVVIGSNAPDVVGTPTYYADQYAGADPSIQINACLAAVASAGAGVCDARKLVSTTPQTMSETISVGTHSQSTPGQVTVLLLPPTAQWNWALTNGTSCGIEQYGDSVIIGDQGGGIYGGVMLGAASSSTNMDSLYCTDPSPAGGGQYIRAEGFSATNVSHGTFASGLFHIASTYDESSFRRMAGWNSYGDVWHIDSGCCGTTFDNIQGYGASSGGGAGYPIVIKGGNTISITNSTFNGPGTGKNNIYVQGSSLVPTNISFFNTYLEKYTTDFSTPMIYVGASAANIAFHDGFFLTGCTTTGCAQYGFENHSAAGFSMENFTLGWNNDTTNCVNDVANSITWPSDGGNTCTSYRVGNGASAYSYSQGLVSYVARQTFTAQAANIGYANLVNNPATNAFYRVCFEESISQAATSSSTLPYATLIYTSAADGNQKYLGIGNFGGQTYNTTSTVSASCATVYVAASSSFGISTSSYASSGATPMQYAVSVTVERQ